MCWARACTRCWRSGSARTASSGEKPQPGILAGLLARPGTDAEALGTDVGIAFASRKASLERAWPGLARVAAAQPERMWLVAAAALPALLASGHTRAFRLLEIATDLAAHLGRADAIPGLAEAAQGRSKLGQAARELASVLSGAQR